MRYWTESDFTGGSQLPTAVAYIAVGLEDALDQRGGMPRLISIGYSEDLEDAYRYEIVIEIVPGVRLPVEFGSTEDDHSAVDPETEGDDVIEAQVSMMNETMTLDGVTYAGVAHVEVDAGGGNDVVTLAGDGMGWIGSTVGAGDGFAVGVVSALLEGRGIADAARRGAWIGARAVQVLGDTEGLPSRAQLDEASL